MDNALHGFYCLVRIRRNGGHGAKCLRQERAERPHSPITLVAGRVLKAVQRHMQLATLIITRNCVAVIAAAFGSTSAEVTETKYTKSIPSTLLLLSSMNRLLRITVVSLARQARLRPRGRVDERQDVNDKFGWETIHHRRLTRRVYLTKITIQISLYKHI